jgi:type IV secretion system protein TrbJ
MKNRFRNRRVFLITLIMAMVLPVASNAQFGSGGIVYDPTNYASAVLRYNQLVQQLAQLRQTYQQVLNQYNLAVQMSRNLQNMAARYRAKFADWRSFTANDLYGNTSGWVGAANGGGSQSASPAYRQATIPLLSYSQADLNAINPADARSLQSAYASLELTDGANVSALTTVGNIRANAQTVQQQIANLEQDSLSADPALNSEVSVLNKINASNVLVLRTMQDANNLRLAALEQQILQAKKQRDNEVANLNFSIHMRREATQSLAPFNSNLTETLANYRLP